MKAETRDALSRLEGQFIPFPTFVAAKDLIEENLFLFRETGIARNIVILGESGTGKSTLCRWLYDQYPRTCLKERDLLRILVVSVPAFATIIGLADAILDALGDPLRVSGTASAKTHRIITLAKGCGVESFLIDEAQHLHDRGKAKTHYFVGDWLKHVIDQLGIPVTLLGLPRLELLLRANEQLRRRFSQRLQLALGQDGRAPQEDTFQLYMSLATLLDVPVTARPYDANDMGKRLYFASDGRVSYIKSLLHAALRIAMERDFEVIDAAVLALAFAEDIWAGVNEELNPFSEHFVMRRLDRSGEPFEQTMHAKKASEE